jgi:ParB family chromosome partitioning protein
VTARSGGLGRGLASLIPSGTAALAAPSDLPLDQIRANPYQPRKLIDDEALQGLAASIVEHGVLQPVLVNETLEGYELIAGERRLRAARMAGLTRIPAIVRQLAARDQLEVALVENIQRADLNPLEEAEAYRQLTDTFGLSQDDVARRVGRARSTIANTLRLLELTPAVQAAIRDGSISEGHARAIASIEGSAEQEALLGAVTHRGLSVRQTEELSRRLKRPLAPANPAAELGNQPTPNPVTTDRNDPETERIESELRAALGTKVSLARSHRGGRIVIEYYDEADLNRLYERLVGGPA